MAPTDVMLALDCPGLDGQNQVIILESQSWTFRIECDVDFVGDVTLMALRAHSLEDCLMACASYSRNSNSNDCIAAEYGTNMTFLLNDYGTYFLKNGTGTVYTSGSNPNPHADTVLTSAS